MADQEPLLRAVEKRDANDPLVLRVDLAVERHKVASLTADRDALKAKLELAEDQATMRLHRNNELAAQVRSSDAELSFARAQADTALRERDEARAERDALRAFVRDMADTDKALADAQRLLRDTTPKTEEGGK